MGFVWATAVLGLVVSLATFGLGNDEAPSPQLFAVGCSGLLYLVVFVVAIVLFCWWFHLLVRHAHQRNRSLDTTPAAAVGSFFIPFLNLVRPYGIAKNIASTEAGVSAVNTWQGLWLVGNLLSNVAMRLDDGQTRGAGDVLSLIGSVLILGAAWACGRMMAELNRTTDVNNELSAQG